mmetsp:Transcript_16243/g.24077  ORF Transcript_16243/g.24077 Transcript_16243/m.24077 type:complete len:443 (+) Transcript_16243:82-1410(+)
MQSPNMILNLVRSGCNLSKHFQSVGVHYSNTSKGSTLLKGLNKKRLRWLKSNLSILKLRQFRGVVNLGTTSLLGLLPQDLGHLACNLGSSAEDNWAVTRLENTGVLLYGNHGVERFDGQELTLLLYVDDITGLNLLVLADTLDGETNRVTGSSGIELLLVLFDGENLLSLKTGGNDTNLITRLEGSLLNGTADDLTNTLDVVNVGDGKTDRKLRVTLGCLDEVVQALNKSETSDGLLGVDVGSPSLVPGSLIGLLDKVVSVESRVWDEGNLLWLEANHLKHLYEFVLDLSETTLVPAAGVHFVDSNNDLLNSEKVKKTGVLTGLSLLNTELGIGLGNSSLETSLLGRNEKKTDISGGRSGDHVLNVILVSGGINNCVVELVSEELLGVALNGHTTLTLLLTGVEVVGETERRLSLLLSHGLELFHLTSGDTTLLEDKVTACG